MGNWPMNSPSALEVLECKLQALFSTGDKVPQQTLQGPLSADIRKPSLLKVCEGYGDVTAGTQFLFCGKTLQLLLHAKRVVSESALWHIRGSFCFSTIQRREKPHEGNISWASLLHSRRKLPLTESEEYGWRREFFHLGDIRSQEIKSMKEGVTDQDPSKQ